jgi:hypothetical protein
MRAEQRLLFGRVRSGLEEVRERREPVRGGERRVHVIHRLLLVLLRERQVRDGCLHLGQPGLHVE